MEKDLLIQTGHSLDDIGRTLSWSALGSFLHNIDINGEIARELDPDLASWSTTIKTNAILADIYDILATINANVCALGTGKKAKQPKPYKRPGDKDAKRIGKKALPPDQLKAWLEGKRKQRKNREVNGNVDG